jgi:hypothetical protein
MTDGDSAAIFVLFRFPPGFGLHLQAVFGTGKIETKLPISTHNNPAVPGISG